MGTDSGMTDDEREEALISRLRREQGLTEEEEAECRAVYREGRADGRAAGYAEGFVKGVYDRLKELGELE